MACTLVQMSTSLNGAAAAVGAACSPVRTTAEIQALAAFIAAAGLKPGLSVEILRLINNTQLTENR